MESNAEIPCAVCMFWKPEKKSFACDPSRCKKLSKWLMKNAKYNVSVQQKKKVQYVV